jgi:hypothetical protein
MKDPAPAAYERPPVKAVTVSVEIDNDFSNPSTPEEIRERVERALRNAGQPVLSIVIEGVKS